MQKRIFIALALSIGILFCFLPFYKTYTCFSSLLFADLFLLFFAAGLFFSRSNASPYSMAYSFRGTHFVQPLAQSAVIWMIAHHFGGLGSYKFLIIYQLLFAYVFQAILSLWLDKKCVLNFSLFPVVLSINMFIWISSPYFYIQLLIVAAAVLGKIFVTRKNGRHIFNPSGFSLALFIYAVIIFQVRASYSYLNWNSAFELVPQQNAYLFVFLVALIPQILARTTFVALGAICAVVLANFFSAKLFGAIYLPTYFANLSAFVGVTLFATDPATAPRTLRGQFVYGAAYGLSILLGLSVLIWLRFPRNFDKLLFLPLLNIFVPYFDKIPLPAWWQSRRGSANIHVAYPTLAYGLMFALMVFVFPFDMQQDCLVWRISDWKKVAPLATAQPIAPPHFKLDYFEEEATGTLHHIPHYFPAQGVTF